MRECAGTTSTIRAGNAPGRRGHAPRSRASIMPRLPTERREGAARVFVPVPLPVPRRGVPAAGRTVSARFRNRFRIASFSVAYTAFILLYIRVYIISSPLSVSLAVRLISYIARRRAPSRPSERNCRAELGAGGGHGRGIVPWCRALVPTAPSLCVPNNYWSASSRRPRAPSKTPLASRGRASSQDPPPAPQAAHQQAYEGFHTCSRPVDGR